MESRLGPEVIVVDVGEEGMLGEHQIEVVAAEFERIGRGLCIHVHVIIGSSGAFLVHERRCGYAIDVDISGTVFTGIVSICPGSSEDEPVFVHAESFLFFGFCRPPFSAYGTGRPASHVASFVAVHAPFLNVVRSGSSGKEGDVPVERCYGVVDVESLLHIIRGDAGSVHYLHAHFIVSGVSKDSLESVLRLILREFPILVLEKPHGNYSLSIHREGNLVDFLVHGDDRLESGSGLGCVLLDGMLELLLCAAGNYHNRRNYIS